MSTIMLMIYGVHVCVPIIPSSSVYITLRHCINGTFIILTACLIIVDLKRIACFVLTVFLEMVF